MGTVTFILTALRSLYAAVEAAEELAHDIAATLSGDDQAELKAKLAEMRAENDASRARRHEKLVAAQAD